MHTCPPCNNNCNQGRTCPTRKAKTMDLEPNPNFFAPQKPAPVTGDAELVARLRGRHRFCIERGEIKTPELMREAADRIEAQAEELATHKAALKEAVEVLKLVVSGEKSNAAMWNAAGWYGGARAFLAKHGAAE